MSTKGGRAFFFRGNKKSGRGVLFAQLAERWRGGNLVVRFLFFFFASPCVLTTVCRRVVHLVCGAADDIAYARASRATRLSAVGAPTRVGARRCRARAQERYTFLKHFMRHPCRRARGAGMISRTSATADYQTSSSSTANTRTSASTIIVQYEYSGMMMINGGRRGVDVELWMATAGGW